MSDTVLDAYIRGLLEAQPGPEVLIAWQGGEPTLMGIDFFEVGLNYLCAGYKYFFHHIKEPMGVMANLVRQGRYADEVMELTMGRSLPE